MLSLFIGLWPLIWHLSLAALVAGGLVAAALLIPGLSDWTRKLMIGAAILIVSGMWGYGFGVRDENARWQYKWDAAEKAAIVRGDGARTDSERDFNRGLRDPQDTDK